VANAVMLESMIEGRRVEAPAPLVERYGELLAPYVVARPRDTLF
jgi:hypothetical protein